MTFEPASVILEEFSSGEPDPRVCLANAFKRVPMRAGAWMAMAEYLGARALTALAHEAGRRSNGLVTDQVHRDAPACTVGDESLRSSARWTKASSTYNRILRQRIAVADNDWRFLRDCGRDQLLAAAAIRYAHATATVEAARRFEALAAALDELTVVGDLPPDTVLEIMA